MSSQLENRKLLDNIGWFVSDHELEEDLSIDGRALQKNEFLEALSNIPMTWTRKSPCDNIILFLYPTTNAEKTTNIQIGPVESVIYSISILPTALEVIGAINSHYSERINSIISNRDIIPHRGMELLVNATKRDLLNGDPFDGLELISPGLYYVSINVD